MLCANPYEWRAVTNLLPFLQCSPFIGANVGANFDRTKNILYTGYTQFGAAQQLNYLGVQVSIGPFGNFPRIMNQSLPYEVQEHKILNPNGSYVQNKFTWSHTALPVKVKFLKIPKFYCIVTNILFDGLSAENDISDIYKSIMNEIQQHAPPTENDVPENNSDEYFDNTYVNYRIGRIDDELTWSQAPLTNSLGANIFLSNDYLTALNTLGQLPADVLPTTTQEGAYAICAVSVPNPNQGGGFVPIQTVTYCAYETLNQEETNEAQNRDILCFRYFPRVVPGKRITAQALYNGEIDWLKGIQPADPNSDYSTVPQGMSFKEYEIIFDNAYKNKNNGFGMGLIPVFWVTHPNVHMRKLPFVAYISKGTQNDGGLGRSFPCPYKGEFIGLGTSPSFTQNKLSIAVNTGQINKGEYNQGVNASTQSPNNPDIVATDVYAYQPTISIGAVDPVIQFDNSFSRFSLSKFHTPLQRGNGVFQLLNPSPADDAADIIESFQSTPAAVSKRLFPKYFDGSAYQDDIYDPQNPGTFNVMPFPFITATDQPYPLISAQAGIGILEMSIPNSRNEYLPLNPWSYTLFEASLFQKMGFSLNQLLPLCGYVNTQLNSFKFNQYCGPKHSIYLQSQNMMRPITTNAIISSSEAISLVKGFSRPIEETVAIPLNTYNLGMANLQASTQANSDSIFALQLPEKSVFPYLVLHSNFQESCGLQYYGGGDGAQLIPAFAQLLCNLQVDDYIFSFQSTFEFIVKKPYVLTNLESKICFPNSRLAYSILGPNSGLCYRIDKLGIPPSITEKKPITPVNEKKGGSV